MTGRPNRTGASWAWGPFDAAVSDFYLTNPIARASPLMAEMSARASGSMDVAAE
jgi:NADH-quinone oxidoreductase subunit G